MSAPAGEATATTPAPATGTPAAPAAPAAPVTPTVVPPNAQPAAATTSPAAPAPGDGLPDDPAALKAEILRLRGENASARTNAKQAAADQARKELTAELAKALGLAPDEQDPAKLTEQLTAAQAAQREAQIMLAVHQSAAAAGVDATKLLNRYDFRTGLAQLDPAKPDGITAAITAAVTADPTLKLAQTAGASSVEHAGGSGEAAKPKTLAEAINKVYGA